MFVSNPIRKDLSRLIARQVEYFSELLARNMQCHRPCNMAMGYRTLFLKVVNDFIFSSVPERLRSLADENFDDPICIATFDAINWTEWLAINFPTMNTLAHLVPRSLVSMVTKNYEAVYQLSTVSPPSKDDLAIWLTHTVRRGHRTP
jgi:hypothetical protein